MGNKFLSVLEIFIKGIKNFLLKKWFLKEYFGV